MPVVTAGRSLAVWRVPAEAGDAWNTHGPFSDDSEHVIATAVADNREPDALCEEAGRPPRTLRRSFLFKDPGIPRAISPGPPVAERVLFPARVQIFQRHQ